MSNTRDREVVVMKVILGESFLEQLAEGEVD